MITVPVGPGWARAAFTQRGDGDMGHGGRYILAVEEDVHARRTAVMDAPWTWLRQVHGAAVVTVNEPGDCAGAVADASITAHPGCPLAILTADCVPVALASAEGVVGAAHAGWAGLAAGVLDAAVAQMRHAGATEIGAVIGPCIRSRCYEFGADDLAKLEARFGPAVSAKTAWGTPALDLAGTVRAALAAANVNDTVDTGACTACEPTWFSWRARREQQRQAMVVWR